MNYNHLNKVYSYWRKKIVPHLSHNFTVSSFDDYLKRFSCLPSGQWIHDLDELKLNRVGFAIDPEKFVKKYAQYCVTHNAPTKVEDGIQRVIYQLSPTFHIEMGIWIWIEHDEIQSYGSLFTAYKDESELLEFADELYSKMKREGNTEEKSTPSGFLGLPATDIE